MYSHSLFFYFFFIHSSLSFIITKWSWRQVYQQRKDCLLFVIIGIQNNMLPEILEVSLYISANNSMSEMEELQGGIFAKHQTRCHCFAAQAALWVSTIFLKNEKLKKTFLYCRGFAVRGNE